MQGIALGVVLAGCADSTNASKDIGGTLTDFTLEDVNSTSASYGQRISPSAHRDMATAWYFGHAN